MGNSIRTYQYNTLHNPREELWGCDGYDGDGATGAYSRGSLVRGCWDGVTDACMPMYK